MIFTTLYGTSGVSLKYKSTNTDPFTFSGSNRSSDHTDVKFNFSPNLLFMLHHSCTPMKDTPRQNLNGA